MDVSVVAAIQRGQGIIAFAPKDGAYTAPTFNEFVQKLIDHFTANPAPNVCFVADNCRIHHNRDLEPQIQAAGFMLQFLPPYSPMLNPIEEVFADIKREIRRLLSIELRSQVLAIHGLSWGEKTPARRALLRTALERAVSVITVHQVDQHFAHSYSCLSRAINQEDI